MHFISKISTDYSLQAAPFLDKIKKEEEANYLMLESLDSPNELLQEFESERANKRSFFSRIYHYLIQSHVDISLKIKEKQNHMVIENMYLTEQASLLSVPDGLKEVFVENLDQVTLNRIQQCECSANINALRCFMKIGISFFTSSLTLAAVAKIIYDARSAPCLLEDTEALCPTLSNLDYWLKGSGLFALAFWGITEFADRIIEKNVLHFFFENPMDESLGKIKTLAISNLMRLQTAKEAIYRYLADQERSRALQRLNSAV